MAADEEKKLELEKFRSNISKKGAIDKVTSIFFPSLISEKKRMQNEGKNFVHYTSASAAKSIIQNKEIWLRQPSCMNDYSEIDHGIQCMTSAYGNEKECHFKKALDNVFNNISSEIENEFNKTIYPLKEESYIFCVSEHEKSEDKHGRLSMWRAYGQETGVALVINNEILLENGPFEVTIMPVHYANDESIITLLNSIADNINEHIDFLKSWPKDVFKNTILTVLRNTILSTKHPGFIEEKEWRVIYSPSFYFSKHLKHKIETINGIPQDIYKLPLEEIPEIGFDKITINSVINKIIIGPTEYTIPTVKAFVSLLIDGGVEDPGKKVFASYLPLRK